MDQLWVEHLNTMDQLRDSIGLRGYGQVDPLIAYKEESLRLFEGLLREIDDSAIEMLLKIKIEQAPAPAAKRVANPLEYHGADETSGSDVVEEASPVRDSRRQNKEEQKSEKRGSALISDGVKKSDDIKITVRDASKKMNQIVEQGAQATRQGNVGRNDPCPCGSGKKYKKCCGK
jgi:preprotein translocase subunit SecA